MNWFNRATLSVALTISLASLKFMYNYGVELGSAKSEMAIQSYIEKINSLQSDLKKKKKEVEVQVVTEYKTKIKTIVKKEKEYVYQATNDVPAQFNMSNGWVYLHDAAATGSDSDSTLSSDGSSSIFKDNQALGIIVENYSICRQNAEQLRALQEFISKTEIKK